jgi:prevent-host-death family protein
MAPQVKSNATSAESITVTEASRLGVSDLVRRASQGHDIVVEKHGTPVAAVIGLARFEQLEDLEADLRSAALVLSRLATDNGVRIGLDEVIDSLGFNRAELEAELDADLRAGRDRTGLARILGQARTAGESQHGRSHGREGDELATIQGDLRHRG